VAVSYQPTEQLDKRDFGRAEGLGHERRAGGEALRVGVATGDRLEEALDRLAGEVDDPVLGDAGTRVERRLDAAVVAQRGDRDLDDQQRGGRMAGAGGVARDDDQVGLGLGVQLGEGDRALHTYARTPGELGDEPLGQPLDRRVVLRTLGTHRDQHPLDQLDAVVIVQQSTVDQLVVAGQGDSPGDRGFLELDRHGPRIPPAGGRDGRG
jgi:hypothetical protein